MAMVPLVREAKLDVTDTPDGVTAHAFSDQTSPSSMAADPLASSFFRYRQFKESCELKRNVSDKQPRRQTLTIDEV
jgi:hypothetical protein